jgi:hypothetical protein
MTSQFEISNETYSCIECLPAGTALDSLGLLDPEASFNDYSQTVFLGNGKEKGTGWAIAEWHWAAITTSQRAVLRDIIPTKSADVFITTQLNDGTFASFAAIAVWPENENPCEICRGEYLIQDFTLKFKNLITI